MKMILTTATAILMAGTAFAQSTSTGTGPAGSYPGNTGRVENGAASNNPGDAGATNAPSSSTMGGMSSSGMASSEMASGSLTMQNGKWMMGDRKATKAEIADWKKAHPGETKPM